MINELSRSNISILSSSILAISFVPDQLIDEKRNKPEFQHILSLLNDAKQKNIITDHLLHEYQQRRALKIREFETLREDIELEVLKDKLQQINRLIQTGEHSKIAIADSIKKACFRNQPDTYKKN